jgi:hypothetical protein
VQGTRRARSVDRGMHSSVIWNGMHSSVIWNGMHSSVIWNSVILNIIGTENLPYCVV